MTGPSVCDYFDASALSYTAGNAQQPGNPLPTPPTGWSYLQVNGQAYTTMTDTNLSTAALASGCYAVALQNNSNPDEIMVAYEGTQAGTSVYQKGTLEADLQLYVKYLVPIADNPEAFNYAARFVTDINNVLDGHEQLYVTGHSLGGVEAEYVAEYVESKAQKLSVSILGGKTFGAPGLPGYINPQNASDPLGDNGGNSPFVNYIENGDPIGNFASDTPGGVTGYQAKNIDHYGTVDLIGEKSNYFEFKDPLVNYGQIAAGIAAKVFLKKPRGGIVGDQLLEAGIYSATLMGYELHYHSLISTYGADIPSCNIVTDNSVQTDPAEILYSLDFFLGTAGQQDLANAAVINGTTVRSADFTVSMNTANHTFTITQNQAISMNGYTFNTDLGQAAVFSYDPTTGNTTGVQITDSAIGSVINDKYDSSGNIQYALANNTDGTSSETDFSVSARRVWDGAVVNLISETTYYTGSNQTGLITGNEENVSNKTSEVTSSDNANHINTVTDYTEPNGQGTGTLAAVEYEVQPGDTYSSIASTLGLGFDGGVVLAAMNLQSLQTETPNAAEIYVPSSVGVPQGWSLMAAPVTYTGYDDSTNPPTPYQYTVTTQTFDFTGPGVLNLDADTFTPLAVAGSDNPQNQVYVTDAAGDLLGVLAFGAPDLSQNISLTEIVTDTPAHNGIQASHVTEYDLSLVYGVVQATYTTSNPTFGIPAGGADLPFFAENGGITTTMNSDATVAAFNAAGGTPDNAWIIGEDASGDATIAGAAGSGYSGTATLTSGIYSVVLGQTVYDLEAVSGTKYTVQPGGISTPDTFGGLIVAEGTGTHNLTFQQLGETAYWHVGGSNDTATLSSGVTEIYLPGNASDYKLSWDNVSTLRLTSDTTLAVTLAGGEGEVNFATGNSILLGDTGAAVAGTDDATEYTNRASGDFFGLDGGNQTLYGDGNTFAYFDAGNTLPDNSWTITANSKGQVTFDGTDAGYDGVVTMTGVAAVAMNGALNGAEDDLVVLKTATTMSVDTSSDAIVAEATGGNRLTFTGPNTSYWQIDHAGDRATLKAGMTELYLQGSQNDYTIAYNGSNVVTLTDGSSITTVTLAGGAGEAVFDDGSAIGLGGISDGFQSTAVQDALEYAGPGDQTLTVDAGGTAYGGAGTDSFVMNGGGTAYGERGAADFSMQGGDTAYGGSGANTYELAGDGIVVNGGAGSNTTTIDSGGNDTINGGTGLTSVSLDATYYYVESHDALSETSAGAVIVNGVAAGYDGPITLNHVSIVDLYTLITTSASGGTTTVSTQKGSGIYGALVVDGPGNDALNFNNNATSYWDVGGGNNKATLNAGYTEINLAGAAAQYKVTYDNVGTLTLVDTVAGRNGTTSVAIGAGIGEIAFADGVTIGLGTAGNGASYGGAGNNTFTVGSASATINGGAGTDTVVFYYVNVAPSNAFNITENKAGQVVVTAPTVGYKGKATLTSIERITLAKKTYNLVSTPNAGGKVTIGTPATGLSGAVVVDGSGNDALTFSAKGISYWYVGGGNNTATLSAGTTDIYLAGASSQYTETYYGTSSVTVKNTLTAATETMALSGGSGELVFGSGSPIELSRFGGTGQTLGGQGSLSGSAAPVPGSLQSQQFAQYITAGLSRWALGLWSQTSIRATLTRISDLWRRQAMAMPASQEVHFLAGDASFTSSSLIELNKSSDEGRLSRVDESLNRPVDPAAISSQIQLFTQYIAAGFGGQDNGAMVTRLDSGRADTHSWLAAAHGRGHGGLA